MTEPLWERLLLSSGNEHLLWELFHENSKNGPYNQGISEEEVRLRVKELRESLEFTGYPIITLPDAGVPLSMKLDEVIKGRISVRDMEPCSVSLPEMATILQSAYGVTRNNADALIPRALRTVPSGGALYPLELFFHSTRIEGLQPGLYHYNPLKNHLRLLQDGDSTAKISQSLLQPDMTLHVSAIFFVTAVFERSIFKYQDRGYRYILLEAGHVAQNINLVSTALGFGSVNIGGFFDREIDEFLDLDGVTHSTIYMIAIGGKTDTG